MEEANDAESEANPDKIPTIVYLKEKIFWPNTEGTWLLFPDGYYRNPLCLNTLFSFEAFRDYLDKKKAIEKRYSPLSEEELLSFFPENSCKDAYILLTNFYRNSSPE